MCYEITRDDFGEDEVPPSPREIAMKTEGKMLDEALGLDLVDLSLAPDHNLTPGLAQEIVFNPWVAEGIT